jgi:uncharacterized protein
VKRPVLLRFLVIISVGVVLLLAATWVHFRKAIFLYQWNSAYSAVEQAPQTAQRERFVAQLVAAALERTQHYEVYDPSYVKIPYPGGDVPDDRGVCSDVIIRAYRKVKIDLQKEVHEDMAAHFLLYPKLWGLLQPDPNIDHRRVPNLMVFFRRKGEVLPITRNPADYRPGDLVCWDLGRGIMHIGMVADRKSPDERRYLIVHNIGAGPRLEDILFGYPIIGHFRYPGRSSETTHNR